MNQTQLQENIAKYYAKLPESLQQFFSSMSWMENLKKISTKYSLTEEQITILGTETTLVLLCIISINEYINILKSELKLTEEQFDQFLTDINDKILKDIGYQLEDVFVKNIQSLENEREEGTITNYQLPITDESVSSNEVDEIPLPPYKTINNEELRIKNGETITDYQLPITKEIAKEKEKPRTTEENTGPNMMEEKLKKPTVSSQTVSDYSKPGVDPYREAF